MRASRTCPYGGSGGRFARMLTGKRGPDDGGRRRLMTYPDNDDLERPEADAAEQAASAFPGEDDTAEDEPTLDDEAPEWDAQEQRHVVRLEDDYR
jgi:hypothetical protein